MKSFLAFAFGLVVGAAGHWYSTQPNNQSSKASIPEAVRESTHDISERLKSSFDRTKIKEELEQTGKVIREKARQTGRAITAATDNGRITATIKTTLLEDSGLSALKIDVDTNDGVVTLSGNVSSPEQVARAMELALGTEGVYKVISTLQVKLPE